MSSQKINYKKVYTHARSLNDSHAYWKDDKLYIVIFDQEFRAVELTANELKFCETAAVERNRSLEQLINELRKQKAGDIKYERLKANQQLPAPPKGLVLTPPVSGRVSPAATATESPSTSSTATTGATPASDTSQTDNQDHSIKTEEDNNTSTSNSTATSATMTDPRTEWINKWDILDKTVTDEMAEMMTKINDPTADAATVQRRARRFLLSLNDYRKELDQLALAYSKLKSPAPDVRKVDIEVIATLKRTITDKRGLFQELLDSATTQPSANNQPPPSAKSHLKLPKLELPKFDGNWRNWIGFKDLFEKLIMSVPDADLPDVTKFQYLKNALGAEPLRVIQSIPVSGANLDRAWKALCSKYDNNNKLKQDYLIELDNIRPMTTPRSGQQLRAIFDKVNDAREAMRVLGEDVDASDYMWISKVVRSMDSETRTFYTLKANKKKKATWDLLREFVEEMCHAWETTDSPPKHQAQQSSKSNSKNNDSRPQRTTALATKSKIECSFCKKEHYPRDCEPFKKGSPDDRKKMVLSKNLCLNCLSPQHKANECPSKNSCRTCSKRHHTMLHVNTSGAASSSTSRDSSSPKKPSEDQPSKQTNTNTTLNNSTVILPTAQILVDDISNKPFPFRALFDSGSQSSYITERAVQHLGLKRKRDNTEIFGLGDEKIAKSHGYTDLTIRSRVDPDFEMTIPALILPRVTGRTPSYKIKGTWPHLEGLELADPHFRIPGEIDVLLSTAVTFKVLGNDKKEADASDPIARDSAFGWVIAGNSLDITPPRGMRTLIAVDDTAPLLERFWALEGLPSDGKEMSEEEKQCEQLFQSTTTRGDDGKFIVQIPFRESPPQIGRSRIIATKRLQGVEARLNRQPQLRQLYEEFMTDYEQQQHMVPVEETGISKLEQFNYLPHHPVIRQQALTTKLRVVFDASCKTENGKSLNQEQLVGPVIQDDLVSILMRFRLHRFAVNGDIEKMYRQIWVHSSQQPLQSIIWRRKPNEPITTFHLTTVTYGTASAPWLATRCLQQVADDTQQVNPKVAEVIRYDFYMDDCLSGADTAEQARELQEQVVQTLANYGFPLRKLASNEDKVIEAVESNAQAYTVNPEPVIKTLGLQWDRRQDAFGFKIQLEDPQKWTKRKLLSEIEKIFDPLGYAAPTTIIAKMLMQEIWAHGTNWDEAPPQPLLNKYQDFRRKLPKLTEVSIPRWTNCYSNSNIELHGFSDASEKAYAAAVYLRVQSEGIYHSHLIAAKTRVAPIKIITLPRLELCGAVLLTQLVEHVIKALRRANIQVFAYTDSTITLAWIQRAPATLKTFVAHRVTQIQSVIPPSRWRHVKSEDNPADLASRGIMPDELAQQQQWFHGPPWLLQDITHQELTPISLQDLPEVKVVKALHSTTTTEEFMQKFSKWRKLLRVTAFILRFANNCKTPNSKVIGPLNPEELDKAFLALCRHIQQQFLSKEYAAVAATAAPAPPEASKSHLDIIRKSKLNNLLPFFDKGSMLIRVGGRLRHSNLPMGEKHPIILPDCRLTRLYLQYLHEKNLHAGPTLLLATARQTVWVIQGKHAARQVVRQCTTCARWRGATPDQQMGDLPASRTVAVRPFHITGLDYAGPVTLQHRRGRGVPTHKGWIAVFVCFSTKAVHLEVVTDQSSECFIAALRRFISRRGRPVSIYCDNGTTFVGADKELQELWNQEKHQLEVADIAADEGIQFKFIPPGAPHMGGLWESAVKSSKHHLRRVLGEARLSYEELTTVLCQIEACLNSRPLCPLTEDSTDPQVLTPGHFLIGQPINKAPDPNLTNVKESHLSRWQYMQRMVREFWCKWQMEYLTTLQQRQKWQHPSTNMKEGQIVLIKEENTPPTTWRLAVIQEVHPGPDGRVRVATLRTTNPQGKVTIAKRPVVKLVPLVDTCVNGGENVQSPEQEKGSIHNRTSGS